jgi:hypothetical protein
MPRGRLKRALVLGFALIAISAGSAGAALVKVNGLILHADGGFQPQTLPRHQFAPIDFQGHFEIAAQGGGQPVALQQAVIDFDRDGRLDATGLPVCQPATVASLSTEQARRACGDAIVGTGRIGAAIRLPDATIDGSSALTIFNGPPFAGMPTVILHARTVIPEVQTYAIVVPIERRRGGFRYRATLDIPPIASGLGAITQVSVKIGRRFSAGGKRRSYVSAHCSDGILQTHGRFTFADGTVIDGAVEKPCTAS